MSEYIPLVLVLGLSGIMSFGLLGNAAKDQGSNITVELAGHEARNFDFPEAGPVVTLGGIGSRPQVPGGGSRDDSSGGNDDSSGSPGPGDSPGGIPGGGNPGDNPDGSDTGDDTGGDDSGPGGGGRPPGDGEDQPDTDVPGEDEPPPLLSVEGLVEFGGGVWDGVIAQGEGILQMVLNPVQTVENFYTLGRALIVDPQGTLAAIADEIGNDIEAVLSGNPREIGRIIGENVSPAALARLAGRLTNVARRLDDDGRTNVSGCSRRSSFTGGTLVWTDSGLKAIREIQVGDYVLSRNERTFEDNYRKVTRLLGREVSHYYEVSFYDSVIQVTEEHPFWQQGAGWIEAQNLYRGEIAAAVAGDLTIREVKRVDEATRVYNFEVADDHTYFVGEYGLWVHNQDDEVCDLRDNIADTYIGRSIEELLPNGRVPSVRNGEFSRWFDDLTPDELDMLWERGDIREQISSRIRSPGGLHEWCMVCRTPDFKRWGVPMEEIRRFRTRIPDLEWTHPDTGRRGRHGGDGSGQFHNELREIIDNSRSLEDFNRGVENLRDRWQIDPSLLPELPRSNF